ncbi:hypothetical protein RRG08_010767 [Elysia crispata]|uniref:Uncharacterized protein n=1 Tax=Elysia crispata TaxID=231223 RepID=A0AAE1A4V3_9GAST|nr:hypothetical protein RRG08_010767 [Elysia crispata]
MEEKDVASNLTGRFTSSRLSDGRERRCKQLNGALHKLQIELWKRKTNRHLSRHHCIAMLTTDPPPARSAVTSHLRPGHVSVRVRGDVHSISMTEFCRYSLAALEERGHGKLLTNMR